MNFCKRWCVMPADKPRVIGVIPARYGSTRLPGKSLIPLCGKPLVIWVLERARQAAGLDDVCVATDDDRIRTVVEAVSYTHLTLPTKRIV